LVDGQFSIRCWIDPNPEKPCDAEAYFDDIGRMEHSIVNLLERGRYRLIVASEWETATREHKKLGTYTLDNIKDIASIGRKAVNGVWGRTLTRCLVGFDCRDDEMAASPQMPTKP